MNVLRVTTTVRTNPGCEGAVGEYERTLKRENNKNNAIIIVTAPRKVNAQHKRRVRFVWNGAHDGFPIHTQFLSRKK